MRALPTEGVVISLLPTGLYSIMDNEDRDRLAHRLDDLRRLSRLNTDSKALAAINEEIAKHEARLAEIDPATAPESAPADQPEEIVAKTSRDTIV
jgi:hypothetical protein